MRAVKWIGLVLQECLIALGVLFCWGVALLPTPLRARFAEGLGSLLFQVSRPRRRVALANLALCFPHWSAEQQSGAAREHFQLYARAFFERFLVWMGSESRLRRLVALEGMEHWQAVQGQPVLVLAPHFLGLDAGGVRLQLECQMVSMYSNQSSPLLNALTLRGRSRFNRPVLLSRQEGIGRLLRLLKQGHTAYFLPDMDFGERDSVFATFFGQPAATVTSLVRLSQLSGAAVLPLVTRMTPTGYEARFYPAWHHRRDEDLTTAVQRMNDFIEARVRESPSQYLWTHRRFKTRPPGQASVY